MAITEADPERYLVEWYGARLPGASISEIGGALTTAPADDYVLGVFAAESAENVAEHVSTRGSAS